MFNGTLCMWYTTPVELELKNDVKPVCSRPYPEPRAHTDMFKKGLAQLVISGVQKQKNDSKCGASYFAQPKAKTNSVQLLSYLWHLKRQLKCNPYPMPKIREISLKSEGFKYATSLDLNMVYYNICISEEAGNLCMSILLWGSTGTNAYR